MSIESNNIKGGPGSGNFGHSGRPGEVGGSSMVFHGTSMSNVKSILKNGLLIDKDKEKWRGLVWGTEELESAQGFGMGEKNRGKYAIVHVDRDVFGGTDFGSGVRVSNKDISASAIIKIDIYKFSSQELPISSHVLVDTLYGVAHKKSTPKVIYVGILIVEDEVAMKGGPGSGNFGHSGRPGEVGGSGSRGDNASEKFSDPIKAKTGESISLQLFHGSDKDFIELKVSQSESGKGIFLTDDWTVASDFGNNFYAVDARLENPFVYDADGKGWWAVPLESLTNQAVLSGHDSLVVKNIIDAKFSKTITNNVIIFDPKIVRIVTKFDSETLAEKKSLKATTDIEESNNNIKEKIAAGAIIAGGVAGGLLLYAWNPFSRAYIPVKINPVSRIRIPIKDESIDVAKLRLLVSQVRGRTSERLARLAEQVIGGKISFAQFAVEFKSELKNLYITTHVLARGGMAQMDQSAWGKLGVALRQQYSHANSFIRDIENERIKLGDNVLRRIAMYTDSAWGARGEFENVIRDREFLLGSMERRYLGDADHCNQCIDLAGLGWQRPGILPGIGDTECQLGCACHFEFKNASLDKKSLDMLKGGPGSGNFGHSGRPGLVGGSGSGILDPLMLGHNRLRFSEVPDKTYVGLSKDWYEGWEGMEGKPIREQGLKPNIHSNFPSSPHPEMIYLATTTEMAYTYANLYSRPLVLEVDTTKLDSSKFYSDPMDVPNSKGQTQQIAYRGLIPPNAISVHNRS